MALFLDEYVKLRKIGEGAFATVYKVRHDKLGYVRAIKVSNGLVDDIDDPKYQTFLRECKVLLQIGNGNHPNIVHIYQPRMISNKAVVEMDYVDGLTLLEFIKQRGGWLSWKEFKRFAREVVGALAYCHADLWRFLMDPDADDLEPDPTDGSRYIVTPEKELKLRAKYCVNHNDLHTNNIMRCNYDGRYVLLDFGLAIQGDHCVKSSSRGDGACEYSSPEKFDEKNITSASDVYSLGVLMFEMLTGRPPFVIDTASQALEEARFRVYQQHKTETPPALGPLRKAAFAATHPGETYTSDFPEDIERIIDKCLQKNPADRYADAKELLADLESLFALEESCHQFHGAPLPPTPAPPTIPTVPTVPPAPAMAAAPIAAATDEGVVKNLRNKISTLERQLSDEQNQHKKSEKAVMVLRSQIQDQKKELETMRSANLKLHKQLEKAQPRKTKRRGGALWVLTFICMLVSTAWTFYLFDGMNDFINSGEIIDQVTVGAGLVSLLGLALIGLFPRAGILIYCLVGMMMGLLAALQYFSNFDEHITLCAISAVGLILFMTLWIRREMHKSSSDNDDSSDDDFEMAEIA